MKINNSKPLTTSAQNTDTMPDRPTHSLETAVMNDRAELVNVDSPTPPPIQEVKADRPSRFQPSTKQFLSTGIALGLACVAGIFSLRWWQFAQAHETTDNATITGEIYAIGPRINGTISEVLVKENQQVETGQPLIELDARDQQSKVAAAAAALETAKRQAAAIQSNIQVANQNATASQTQARGGISNSSAGIASAQSALVEAQSGVPIAADGVVQARSGITTATAVVAEAQSAIPAAQAALAEAQAGIPAAQSQIAQIDANLSKAKADYARYQSLQTAGAAPLQQLDIARASYQTLIAQRLAAVQGVQQAKSKVAQAQEAIVAARAKLAQAQEGVAKAKSLLSQSQSALIQAKSRVGQAQEGVVKAKAQLTTSQGAVQQAQASTLQTDVNKSQYQAALATVAQSAVALKDAQLQLSYTTVVAPSSGKIGNKNVEVGQQIQAGTPLMAIVANQPWAIANFKETQLSKMHPGQKVEIAIDSFAKHPFIGRIESLSPASGAKFALLPPDNATGNFTKIVQRIPVKIVFDPDSIKGYESRVAPGMSATVTVTVKD
jgi:membrane fusion protein, multidrug efflux system